jgi:hypothetical protein
VNIKFSGFTPVERRNLMIKTERKSFDFPIEYLLTKEAVDKAADVFIDKFEELGLIESYWVNYSLYWFCKNHRDHHPSMSCECCAKVKEELQNEEDHLYAGIRIRAMESTIKFISERLEPSLLNKSFCDYFKNVRFENTTFSKNDGFYLNNVGTGEFSFTPLIGDCLNIFELENKVSGFKRISQSNRIYSVILKAISQSPKVIGDYIKKYEDVDGNSVILSEGGFENSFYYAFTSFFDKFVTKVSKDNDFLNKQDNYIEMMKVELGDFFVKVHELNVDSTKTEIKLYLESIFKSIVENLYELLETEEPEHNFIFKTDYEKCCINFKIPKELTTLPIKYLPTKENNFSFLSTIVFYKDGKIGEEDFRRIANQFLDNKDNFLQYFKNLISERLESLYSYGPYYIRNLSNDLLLEDELEEIGLLYKFILELFETKEDPELIQELNFAKEYLKEILS